MNSLPERVAVVLGAGGPAASAVHIGLLRALRADHGMELSEAALVVATSAGAALAASIRAGAGLDEAAQWALTPPGPEDRDRMRAAMAAKGRSWRPLAPRLAAESLTQLSIGRFLGGVLPPGRIPNAPMSSAPKVREYSGWPERLWIPSVRVRDGRRIVFGRDRLDVSLADAVEASSAVPGIFVPKRIGADSYLDGATFSADSADLAADPDIGTGIDLAIICSVQTRPGGSPLRRAARLRLRAELRALRVAAVPTVVLQPDAALTALLAGFPRRSTVTAEQIIGASARQTRNALAKVLPVLSARRG